MRTLKGTISALFLPLSTVLSASLFLILFTFASSAAASQAGSYKVLITADSLNIRATASLTSEIKGVLTLGELVDVTGEQGGFLKTATGYIAKNYTKKIQGMYIRVLENTNLLDEAKGNPTNRLLVKTKSYQVAGSKNDRILILSGRIRGYVSQNAIAEISEDRTDKITIAWDNVNNRNAVTKECQDPASYVNKKSDDIGLDILSPTWFDVGGDAKNSSSITVNDLGSKAWADLAHSNGYEIWPRLGEMSKTRAAVEFSNATVRNRIINQVVQLALKYDVDGINIDYEALGESNKNGFTAFMKALYPVLQKNKLKVSIDVTKYLKTSPLYSLCYDRPQLAKYSDYLVLMGYDEHVAGSTEPGSVGSYTWVDNGIMDMLAQGISKDKLLLGIPFYLRDYSVLSVDSVIAKADAKLYRAPVESDTNKLCNGTAGSTYDLLGMDKDWYWVNVNGTVGYISRTGGIPQAAGSTTGQGAAVSTAGGISNISTAPGIVILNKPNLNQSTGAAVVQVPTPSTPGASGQNRTTNGAVTTDSAILPGNVQNLMLTAGMTIYKSKFQVDANVVKTASKGTNLKYKGQSSTFYVVDYNGSSAYIAKTKTTLAKADTRATGSKAISMLELAKRMDQYNGSTDSDDASMQKVARYYVNNTEHMVWVEDQDSISWRMDMILSYDLAGAAIWSLNWKPTDDIWPVIKDKMK